MALTKISTDGFKDDAVTTDKLANAINTERTANTAKVSTTINNNADNRVITGSGTANTLEGESGLTYNGTRLNVGTGDLAVTGAEGGDAQLRLTADEGDDGADYWRLESKASDNNFNLATYSTGAWVDKVTVNTSGVTIKGATNAAARLLLQNTTSVRTNYIGLSGDDDRIVIAADDADQGSNSTIDFKVDGSERMRIDSSGNVGIGTTQPNNADSADGGLQINPNLSNGSPQIAFKRASTGNTSYAMVFVNGNVGVGSIGYTNSGTSFNTSSDYRLKENVTAISDGITRLKTLKPSRFNFKVDTDTTVDGFLAHEVTAVPEAITGTKDAVDSDNKPIYQGIDQSKLVPLLTAALQEAITEIETLKTKVAALEAA
jgi:hypothetical protein